MIPKSFDWLHQFLSSAQKIWHDFNTPACLRPAALLALSASLDAANLFCETSCVFAEGLCRDTGSAPCLQGFESARADFLPSCNFFRPAPSRLCLLLMGAASNPDSQIKYAALDSTVFAGVHTHGVSRTAGGLSTFAFFLSRCWSPLLL